MRGNKPTLATIAESRFGGIILAQRLDRGLQADLDSKTGVNFRKPAETGEPIVN